jgi:hypothetical protein
VKQLLLLVEVDVVADDLHRVAGGLGVQYQLQGHATAKDTAQLTQEGQVGIAEAFVIGGGRRLECLPVDRLVELDELGGVNEQLTVVQMGHGVPLC